MFAVLCAWLVQQTYPESQLFKHSLNTMGKVAVHSVKMKEKLFLLAKATQEHIPLHLGGQRTCAQNIVSCSKDNWLNKGLSGRH